MITPKFTCSQTESSVIVSIYCPSIRAADVEIHIDETLATIHVNPYFLRLNFSKPLVEDNDSAAKYDPSSGYLIVTLTKEYRGERFEDLDLLAKLLVPRRTANVTPTIEVLTSEDAGLENLDEVNGLVEQTENLTVNDDELVKAAENDWQLTQNLSEESGPQLQTSPQAQYGFLDLHSGYLRHAAHTENEINELGTDAEVCTSVERSARRVAHENEKFDEEHYIADFMDDYEIQEMMEWPQPHVGDAGPFEYRESENLVIMTLPRREYLPTPVQTHNLYLVLITLLFSYTYDTRITQHEPTSESPWTICNLTPAFSALDPPRSSSYQSGPHKFTSEEVKETFIPSYRRSLAFPLYRSFALAEKCRHDVGWLLKRGRRTITRCLLEMKHILDHHDVYYIYSKIWVDDFCVWIQSDAHDEILEQLGEVILTTEMRKMSIGWDLKELEDLALESPGGPSDSDDESSNEN
ncbi:SHQ1 protein-domain-containing protein [Crepidotus variabilis]|uniref:SHQ1 protein-domain-containing protein n=1 Tax=Crepidotus variabilis TaxID=179855 RepID=A0A9P6EQF6_9AGAR|nr:SHQ1 protein-domain-containing protein [Crepidotus variabilis]